MGSLVFDINLFGRDFPTMESRITRILFTLVQISTSLAMKTHFVYWNSTNPAFRNDNSDHILDVNQGNLPWEYDQLHLICPKNTQERHVVYSVSEEEFKSCRVTSPRPKIVAICNKPESFMYFTITFRSFSPTPGGLEFKPGQNYYFISTSTRRDLHRRVGGYCSTNNMRMVFKVADNRVKEEDNMVQINLNEPRKMLPTLRTTSPPPRIWSARVPQYRNDYIYYYRPWNNQRSASYSSQAVKIQELNNNEVLTALPFTSSSSNLGAFSVASAMLISYLATKIC